MLADFRLYLTTCGSRAIADRLAGSLVERRLAACVSVLPGVSSTYRWGGKIERADEVLVIIKSSRDAMQAIEDMIRNISGYELPELLAIDIAAGSTDYLAWLGQSLSETQS